jgi:protein gp37
MCALLADPGFVDEVWAEVATLAHEGIDITRHAGRWGGWPLPNVEVGVSAEDQYWAGLRLPALEATPAAVRFVSCEPLLGPIDLSRWVGAEFGLDGRWQPAQTGMVGSAGRERALDWVIVGGESGHHARPVEEWWIGDLVDQATAGGVPVFVKQLGTAWARTHGQPGKGTDPAGWPEHLRIRQLPTPARAGVRA